MSNLQPRDERIIQVCYEHQFLLVEQINRYFFKLKSNREAYRRVKELEARGIFRREWNLKAGAKKIVRLTRHGELVAATLTECDVSRLKHIDPITFQHNRIVANVRLRLQEFWNAQWITEHHLREHSRPPHPDGVLRFEGGVDFAIEVENTQKERLRFLDLLEQWASRGETGKRELGIVLYVATYPQLFRTLQKYLQESRAKERQRFGLVLWSELEAGTPTVWTPNGELNLLRPLDFTDKTEGS